MASGRARKLLLFEWVLFDNCDLSCSYCVSKGEVSQKPKDRMRYVPGREVEIARRILEWAPLAERIRVNLTGGEPLLARSFIEVLRILSSDPRISVSVITNMSHLDRVAEELLEVCPGVDLLGSIHVRARTDAELARLAAFLRAYRGRLRIALSQVDHGFTPEEQRKLAMIEDAGGRIAYQTFIPPWTEAGRVEGAEEIRKSSFATSRGKRCGLGYSDFLLDADGTLRYGLWCNGATGKTAPFLSAPPEEVARSDMLKCPFDTCGCNYNLFHRDEYVAECEALGYPSSEVFGTVNERRLHRVRRRVRRLWSGVVARLTRP